MTNTIHRYDEVSNSWTITSEKPPRHWYNYLWSRDGYCAQISQGGHGTSFYLTGKGEMCRLNCDSARYFYLRDEESKRIWSPGGFPVNQDLDYFECVHSIGETVIRSRKDELVSRCRVFVPTEGFQENWEITISNEGSDTRQLSLFSLISFELEGFSYPRYYEVYRTGETFFDSALNGVYCSTKHPFAPHNRYNGFIASPQKVHSYDGDLHAFLGTGSVITRPDASLSGLYQQPEVLHSGEDCRESETSLFMLGGVLQHTLQLLPGESKSIHLIIGLSTDLEESRQLVQACSGEGYLRDTHNEAIAFYQNRYSRLVVSTPDSRINRIMNSWVQKQVEFCAVGKKGVRDNLQIAVGLLNYLPDMAQKQIEAALSHQFTDGTALLTWYPYDDIPYSDQPFWIIWATCQLIKETGDLEYLNKMLPYQDGGEGTILEHLEAAARPLLKDRGPHKLVKIKFADWNDALNIMNDENAESVMVSAQACIAFAELSLLYKVLGHDTKSSFYSVEYEVLKESINTHGWDGKWYLRALSKNGDIGSASGQGSSIYLNAQVWTVLAGIPDETRLTSVLKAIDGMEHPFGFPISDPPNSEFSPLLGRMSGMLPGLFENGGVYCHATAFKAYMDCFHQRADKSVRALAHIIPASPDNPSERSGAEPYVFTNCYATHPKYYGKSYQSWTTGTSAWAMIALFEGIFGIRRGYEGLSILPCFPSSWEDGEVRRVFRGTNYRICYSNPGNREAASSELFIDGQLLEGNLLPLFDDNDEHLVEVKFSREQKK
jgi:cellobiose phosphorylase